MERLRELLGDRYVNLTSLITQYVSTVYIGIATYGLSPLNTIYTDFVHFHFQFEVDFTFNDIKVKNM